MKWKSFFYLILNDSSMFGLFIYFYYYYCVFLNLNNRGTQSLSRMFLLYPNGMVLLTLFGLPNP